MDIVKKNLISIICGVLALVAVVVAFVWPLDGWIEELTEGAKQRAALQAQVNTLAKKQRTVPNFDPAVSTPAKLVQFPSREIIDRAKAAVKQVKSTSENVYEKALADNQVGRKQVVEGSLPLPISQPLAIRYRTDLQAALDKMRLEDLQSGIPPTEEELKKRADALWKELAKQIIMVGGKPTNLPQVQAQFNADVLKLPEQMQREMASTKKMYVDPSKVMQVPAFIPADGSSADPVGIWWAQVYHWVTGDVVAAIRQLNDASPNVLQSPVKNLLVLNVPDSFFRNQGDQPRSGSDEAATPPALPDPTVAVTEAPDKSPTKRVSNNLFDVLHFTVAVDIEADAIPRFVNALSSGRMVSVIRMETFPVDPKLKQLQGYVYGNKPVMTLVLECEAIFMRSWTHKLMPPKVRETLGVPDPNAGGGARASLR